MNITPEFKAMVKQALKELKEDAGHEQLHAHIRRTIAKRLKTGRTGGAYCSLCRKVIEAKKV